MSIVREFDNLIEAERAVLESDFDPVAFLQWRRSAFDCLTEMLGPDHVYTRQFGDYVQQGAKTDLLVSAGILSAVQHGIAGQGMEVIIAITNPNATPLA
jgi:hypothetical protein